MALSEAHDSGIRLRRVEGISPNDSVTHVDQLQEEELEALLAGADGGPVLGPTSLEVGDVIAFTDFYRVERA